jgi:hypothetical protein
MQMKQPGNLRASLNHYAFLPEKPAQLAEFAKIKLTIPVTDTPTSIVCSSKTASRAVHHRNLQR